MQGRQWAKADSDWLIDRGCRGTHAHYPQAPKGAAACRHRATYPRWILGLVRAAAQPSLDHLRARGSRCRNMPDETIAQLEEIAGKTGRTRNELVLMCIDYALERLEISMD